MKIYAFEVRNDELESFRYYEEKYSTTVICSEGFLTKDNIKDLEPGSAVSVLGMCNYGKEELALLKKQGIEYISTRTIGYDHIDVREAKALGMHVCNATYQPDGVAEYTIMMMLLCLRKYKQALWRGQVNNYSLTGLQGKELRALTVGVIGTGKIGATVARDLSGFGCKILAYDVVEREDVKAYAKYVPLEEIYKSADIITLHVPLTNESKHMINDEAIAKMKKGVVLINCARGGLMDVYALIRGIETEKIGALGLDCLEKEESIVHRDRTTDIFSNMEMSYLKQFKNVVYTQHMAFYTDMAVDSMVECGVRGLVEMLQSKPCKTQIC